MSGKIRVMVDIETLGTQPGSSILSIGAVKFDEVIVGDEFYRSIDLQSCQDAGLSIDAGTLQWWLDQDSEVQDALVGGDRLIEVLDAFIRFYGDADEIWAKPPSFDCVMLEEAFNAVGMEVPWGHRDRRDCRTLASLPEWEDEPMEGDEHNALHDAKHQATLTAKTLNSLRE